MQFSPLHVAANFGHEKVVEVLIHHDADINLSGSVGDRPLHLAAGKGYLKVTQLLVKGKGDHKADGMCFRASKCYEILMFLCLQNSQTMV